MSPSVIEVGLASHALQYAITLSRIAILSRKIDAAFSWAWKGVPEGSMLLQNLVQALQVGDQLLFLLVPQLLIGCAQHRRGVQRGHDIRRER